MRMSTRDYPLDERYFVWLYGFIGNPKERAPRRTHWELAKLLYQTEYRFSIRNDENRCSDGLQLRELFLRSNRNHMDLEWEALPCSVLEMLIALADRADFASDEGAMPGGGTGWFWHMMDNVGLSLFTDEVVRHQGLGVATQKLNTFLDRRYSWDGSGGLFPLSSPNADQTTVEIWYQLNAYLLDTGYVQL